MLFRSLPVSLPPAGTYAGIVEAAWEPGLAGAGAWDVNAVAGRVAARSEGGASHAAEIQVSDKPGRVEIRSEVPIPDFRRLRVTLMG